MVANIVADPEPPFEHLDSEMLPLFSVIHQDAVGRPRREADGHVDGGPEGRRNQLDKAAGIYIVDGSHVLAVLSCNTLIWIN